MFFYWKDLEMVGSDTRFDMVLSEQGKSAEFVACFLANPLFGSCQPHIYYYNSRNNRSEKIVLTRKGLMELIQRDEYPTICIDVNCQIMDALPGNIQRTLYQLSETRIPNEAVYGNVESPCMAPVEYRTGQRGNMTVTFTIMPPETKKRWFTDKSKVLNGYVHHEELLISTKKDYPCYSLSVRSGFYYEYAIYLMEYLREHFPGLGTAGGVDNDGRWTDGFNYSNSIYNYEKIRLPIRSSVEHTMKRLRDCDIIRSYRTYYRDGWRYDKIEQFRMANIPEEYPRKERIFFFSDYVDYVEWVLQQEWDTCKTICATAVHVILPKPEQYGRCMETTSHLRRSLEDVRDEQNSGHYCGYLSFALDNDEVVGEFRIPWYMKDYLLMLLHFKDTGKIDQIKSQMYHRQIYE